VEAEAQEDSELLILPCGYRRLTVEKDRTIHQTNRFSMSLVTFPTIPIADSPLFLASVGEHESHL
jgi:hypothetical protein